MAIHLAEANVPVTEPATRVIVSAQGEHVVSI